VSALTIPFLVKGPSFSSGIPGESEIDGFRSRLCNADAMAFLDYWRARCSETGIPEKADIDPIELPRLLSAIYIEEWDEQRRQSRIRLAGEFHREVAGFNVQGLSVDEHADGETSLIWKQCDQFNFFQLRPTFCGYDLGHVKRQFRYLADVTLPVRDGSDGVLAFGFVWPLEGVAAAP
jgi:PAS domain